MLTHLLSRGGCHIDAIGAAPVSALCISTLPPASSGQARALYRRIKGQNPELRAILEVWTIQETTSDLPERVGVDPDMLLTSLADCAYQIHMLCENPG